MAGITMHEIAGRVGVSVAAVSMALNGRSGVSDAMRERILAEAVSCGYPLDRLSGGTRKGHIVVFDVDSFGRSTSSMYSQMYTSLMHGIDMAAAAAGYAVDVMRAEETRDLSQLGAGDGVLLLDSKPNTDMGRILMESGRPFVALSNPFTGLNINTVTYDNRGAIRRMVEELAALGHRRLGYVHLMDRHSNYYERRRGFEEAVRELGLEQTAFFEYGTQTDGTGDVCERMGEYIDTEKPDATAYVCGNDYIALAAMRAFRLRGIEVGRDVAFAGFDDAPFAQLGNPPLATVRINEQTLGGVAAERLISLMRDPAQPAQHTAIALEFVKRESMCAAEA